MGKKERTFYTESGFNPILRAFFLPDRPTHLYEREGDGKRNILLGWPNKQCLKDVSGFVTVNET